MASLTYTNTDYYLAGLFDGEGCVAVRQYTRQYTTTSLSVSVTMTDKAPIQKFVTRFGGTLREPSRLTHGGKRVYQWELCGTTAEEALKVFSAICINKKSQIDLALKVVDSLKWINRGQKVTPQENKRRKTIAEEIGALKRAV